MEPILSNDRTPIHCQKSGTGAPVLLVHGTTADHTRWNDVTGRLEQRHTVYAMDRRGRGGSGDAADYHIDREAEDVARVVDAIGEPTFVVGHSYGAVCSLEAALLTDGIRKLVLYEPPIPTGKPMYPPGLPDSMQALIDKGESEAALEMFMREVVQMPEPELARYRKLPMWEGRVRLAHTIPRELAIDHSYQFDGSKFADLGLEVRLLVGGDSPPLFQQAAEVVHDALPNASVAVLQGQQHIAMDTDLDLFISEVNGFLQ